MERKWVFTQRKELLEQIGKLNLKIATSNKELEELELNFKRKKLELRKYKNERTGLQLELQELEIANWKAQQEKNKINRMQKKTIKKYAEDLNNEYYSQEKRSFDMENSYTDYIKKNILPYNDWLRII